MFSTVMMMSSIRRIRRYYNKYNTELNFCTPKGWKNSCRNCWAFAIYRHSWLIPVNGLLILGTLNYDGISKGHANFFIKLCSSVLCGSLPTFVMAWALSTDGNHVTSLPPIVAFFSRHSTDSIPWLTQLARHNMYLQSNLDTSKLMGLFFTS